MQPMSEANKFYTKRGDNNFLLEDCRDNNFLLEDGKSAFLVELVIRLFRLFNKYQKIDKFGVWHHFPPPRYDA